MSLKVLALCVIGLGMVAAGAARAENPVVVMETSLGTIKVELYEDKAPITVKNFLGYVDDKFYDGTIFHRVIKDFMIQGGGFTDEFRKAQSPEDAEKAQKKTKEAIQNESANGLSNQKGTIAMARTSRPNSATAQFFINTADNTGLDRANSGDGVGYCVFGRVTDGMDVVDKIRNTKTIKSFIKVGGQTVFGDVPDETVVIKSVKRVQK